MAAKKQREAARKNSKNARAARRARGP